MISGRTVSGMDIWESFEWDNYLLADTRRRLRNILQAMPARTWTLHESQEVMVTLEDLLRQRLANSQL